MTRTIDQMIASEVLCCMSSLVATLAAGFGQNLLPGHVAGLAEQAFDLTTPIDDWEEAARYEGWAYIGTPGPNAWYRHNNTPQFPLAETDYAETAQAACEHDGVDPYQTEIFEHWAVTDWFADKLEAAGEKVDRDFAGLCVWGRTTTGQNMTMDGVVQRIYAQTHTA